MKKTLAALLTIIILTMFAGTGCSTTQAVVDNSYPAVVAWNYIVYGLSVETIPSEQLSSEIGSIARIMNPLPKENGDSNVAAQGSRLYTIKDVSQLDAIAVFMDGKYYKAYKSWILQ